MPRSPSGLVVLASLALIALSSLPGCGDGGKTVSPTTPAAVVAKPGEKVEYEINKNHGTPAPAKNK